jgi:hypothetical protein
MAAASESEMSSSCSNGLLARQKGQTKYRATGTQKSNGIAHSRDETGNSHAAAAGARPITPVRVSRNPSGLGSRSRVIFRKG